MGWFRRGHKSASVRDFLVYVYRYPTELAGREEYGDFAKWLKRAGIDDWVFVGLAMAEDEDGIFWYIAVVDATPDLRTRNEFRWTGDFQEIDKDWAMDILSQTEGASNISRMLDPEPVALVMRPDGTWAIPKPEG